MRAKEFIVEYKEYPTREYGGVTFTMKEKDGQLIVKPLNDYGISMGHVVFNMDGKILDPQDLVIADKYQGQGIAKVMYDYVKSLGFTIERSWDQTDAGAGFWDKHRGEDVRVWEEGVAEGLNESAYEEAWELISQPVPEIQQFVQQLGLSKDDATAKEIAPMIDAAPDTQIPAASIPKLKNLANKGNDVQTLKAIQQISGRPDAAQQYAKLMQARDAGEGRNRGYDVSGLIKSVQSGNYEAPVLLKLPTGLYVIGGRTRLYAALALNIPAKVKIISANNFKQGVAEGSNEDIKLSHTMSPDILYVHATSGNTDAGGARFKKIDGVWTGDIVYVYPQFRRQGVATKIYDYAENLVGKITPSNTLKPKGKKFWASREKQGVAEEENNTFSSEQVLNYIKSIHMDGWLPAADNMITRHKTWTLKQVPISSLQIPDPDIDDFNDPYGRVHDTDLHHVDRIVQQIATIIQKKPIVIDPKGHILDGNHRALAALKAGLKTIPAYIPAAQIKEARRNPKHNRKFDSGRHELYRWVADHNIGPRAMWGLSMTMLPKLGINPQKGASDDTPKGIYFYPLWYIWPWVNGGEELPWGNDFPYIQLFQYDNSRQMTQQSKVDPAQLNQALRQYCPEEIIENTEYNNDPYWFIYDCLVQLGQSDETTIVRWNKVLRDLGFTSVMDEGKGWIATNEPVQGIILDPRIIKQVKTFENYQRQVT